MRVLVETGRFIVTTLAVAIAIPAIWLILSVIGGDPMSIEAFLGIGAISFVMALTGGLVAGLPALWVARRQHWHQRIVTLAAFGTVAGAIGGMVLSAVFWQGNVNIILPSLLPWAVMGAVAGLVSAAVWLWLHCEEWEQAGDA